MKTIKEQATVNVTAKDAKSYEIGFEAGANYVLEQIENVIKSDRILGHPFPSLESADMYYFRQIDNDYFPPNVESICPIPLFKDGKEDFNYDIRCWSLAALHGILTENKICHYDDRYYCQYISEGGEFPIYSTSAYNNPVDACCEMIMKLHEQKLL